VLALAALALLHPAPRPALESAPAAQASGSTPLADRRKPRRRRLPAQTRALVYVVGAVSRPGLYRVPDGARVADAVTAAGGLTSQADAVAVNLAAFVGDGDEVIVPRAGEAAAVPPPRMHRARKRRARALPPSAVDVNSAAADDLAAVPGIGRALAVRIVELRERDGAFDSLDELLDVSGMTDARLERARPFLKPP